MTRDDLSRDREFLYLTILSPRDAKWKQNKQPNLMTASAYAGTAYDKYHGLMKDCSGWLLFKIITNPETGEKIHKLESAKFCRLRHCPICQWRKAMIWRGRTFKAVNKILIDYPGKRFIYLTLTVRNCELAQLGDTITHMNQSWQRLHQRRDFPAIGWMRNLEVTRAFDIYYANGYVGRHGQTWIDKWINTQKKGSRSFDESKIRLELTDEVHPHFHALLMVNPGYFSNDYISQKEWIQLWRESLRVDYDPSVTVNVVKPRGKQTTVTSELQATQLENQPAIDDGLAKAIRYTLKYSNKPDELLITDTSELQNFKRWLELYTEQLHGKKAVATGGIFRQYLSTLDPKNLIIDEDSLDTGESAERDDTLMYVWKDEASDYIMAS